MRSRFNIFFALLLVAFPLFAREKHPAYSLMVDAARKMQSAERCLYSHKKKANKVDVTVDPNRTGLVGEEYTKITTTIGVAASKRTATVPDCAAYIVRLFIDNGISASDTVLVTMTGSFPGLDLAVCIALETLAIPSFRICSLGASSYGANQEGFSWIEMEDLLVRCGKLSRRSDYVTLGGVGDVGGGLDEKGVDYLREVAARLHYPLMEATSLRTQATLRRALLGSPEKYQLLINIGGNHAMLGLGPGGRELPGGWIDPQSNDWRAMYTPKSPGIVFDFLKNGVPVLNLRHVEDLAESSGLVYDPQPLPRIGTSDIYYRKK